MLNEEKIILMTKLAIYEKGEGKKEIPMSRYYRNDYVGVHMLYTFLSVTAGYVLLFALYIARDVEEFLSSLTTMDLRKFIFTALAIYIGAVLFSLLVAWVLYRHRFKKNRQHLNEYYGNLKSLKRIQKKEQAAAMKIVEGKEAEDGNAPKENAAEDDLYPEDAEDDDIFREPEQQGYFRRRKAGQSGKRADAKNGEDTDLHGGEDEDEVPDLYSWEEDEPHEGKNTDDDEDSDGGEDRNLHGGEDEDLYDGEDEDPYSWEEDPREGKNADDTVNLNIEEDAEEGPAPRSTAPEQTTDPKQSMGTERTVKPERTMDPEQAMEPEQAVDPKQTTDPERALEEALKKLIMDNSDSDDDEEDGDGFTFSS